MTIDEIAARIDHELIIRNDLYPNRDGENDRKLKKLLEEFVKNLKDIGERSSFKLIDPAGQINIPFKDSAVFLCGYMKSGTTLLLELLDGHPELIVMPGDSWFIDRIQEGTEPSSRSLNEAWDHWIKRMINPTGQKPFWILGRDVKKYSEFRYNLDYWFDLLPRSWSSILISVVLSYYCSWPHSGQPPKFWIEKTPGNEFKIEKALRFFPEAKFIHIVRDPRENIASLKRLYETRKWKWNPWSVANKLGASCKKAVENQELIGKERYYVIQYEALTENPALVMTGIIDFLKIKWHDCLLQPTVNSKLALSNTMYRERKVCGKVRSATKDKWRTILTPSEKRAIRCILRDASNVGYQWNVTIKDYCLNTLDRLRTRR